MQGVHLRKYGVAATIDFELYEVDGVDFRTDWIPATGDVFMMRDEAAEEQVTNAAGNADLSTLVTDEGKAYSITLALEDMQAARVTIYLVDQATKAFLDKVITVETYGNAAAQHAFDLDVALQDINVVQISGDETAADNLELQYDTTGLTGDTFPSTQAQLTGISNTGAASNEHAILSPNGFTILNGLNESVNKEDVTHADDGVIHSLDNDGANILDCYYIFDIGGAFVPTNILWHGRVAGNNDDLTISVNTGTIASPNWETRSLVLGSNSSTFITHVFKLFINDIMTGVDAGKVALRFNGTGLSSATLFTNQILCEKTSKADNTGYSNGAIFFDDTVNNENTVSDVDGTARRPVSTWAAVKTLMANLGLSKVEVANGSTVVLDAYSVGITLLGDQWFLELGTQMIDGSHFDGAQVTGIGVSTTTHPEFVNCHLGAVTLPPSHIDRCGIGDNSGTFTSNSAGEFVFTDCYSLVPGSGVPIFLFAGRGPSTGINNRGWRGGSNWTLDDNCVFSHEVSEGGGTTITTGGADVEIRGTTRSITITASAAETIQFVGITGPIILNGTTTATFNLYGVSAGVTDNTSAGTVNDKTVKQDTIEALPSAADNADVVWDELLTGALHNISGSAGRRLRQINAPVILEGVSPGTLNTSTRIQLEGDASSTDGTYDPAIIVIYEGKGMGQSRQIFEYDGSNKLAYINRDWKVIPDNTSKYLIIASSGNTHVNEGVATGGGASSITLNILASDVDDTYVNQVVFIVAGTGQDQASIITAYNGTSKIATVEPAWATQPIDGSIYAILPVGGHSMTEIQAGLATEDKQNEILEDIADVKGTGFVKDTDSLKTIKDKVDTITSSTPVNIDHSSSTVKRSSSA